jgi:hypothetical protein
MKMGTLAGAQPRRPYTTEELADFASQKVQSVRKRYSLTGSFHGVIPIKLGRRVLWPADSVDRLFGQGT